MFPDFFDADGYVTLTKIHQRHIAYSPVIGFTNTRRELVELIKAFLFGAYNLKGHISKKKALKAHHSDGYDLKYSQDAAFELCNLLQSNRPVKREKE